MDDIKRVCKHPDCDKEFAIKSTNQQYCSSECSTDVIRTKRRAYMAGPNGYNQRRAKSDPTFVSKRNARRRELRKQRNMEALL